MVEHEHERLAGVLDSRKERQQILRTHHAARAQLSIRQVGRVVGDQMRGAFVVLHRPDQLRSLLGVEGHMRLQRLVDVGA